MALFAWCRPRPENGQEVLLKRIEQLEAQILNAFEKKSAPAAPPLIIHHADKVCIEKLEHSNHFGTVEIQQLSGRLNIGLNYSGMLQDENVNQFLRHMHPPPVRTPDKGQMKEAPLFNIRGKEGLQ